MAKQVEKLENTMREIDERYANVQDSVTAQMKLLQATITQSQDVRGAITDLQAWLDEVQTSLASQQPVALELPLIAEQEKQFKLVAADVAG